MGDSARNMFISQQGNRVDRYEEYTRTAFRATTVCECAHAIAASPPSDSENRGHLGMKSTRTANQTVKRWESESELDLGSTSSYFLDFSSTEDEDEDKEEDANEDTYRYNDIGCFQGLRIDPPQAPPVLFCARGASHSDKDTSTGDLSDLGDLEVAAETNSHLPAKGYWKLHKVTITRDYSGKNFLPSILEEFRTYLESNSFEISCHRSGLVHPSFAWKQPVEALADQFLGHRVPSTLNREVTLGLAFHGTADENIQPILRNGLDPKRRNGQTFGPGEYFGKEPGVSLSYCRGGCRMLVFCVVVSTPSSQEQSPRLPTLPPGYVVVQERSFQLPLGVLSFSSVSESAIRRSCSLRGQLQRLQQKALVQENLVHEATLKANIIQMIIAGEIERASHCFKKSPRDFSGASRKEIAFYAYQKMDSAFVDYYFDSCLPPPSDCSWESLKANIRSVEEQEREVAATWKKVDETEKKLKNCSGEAG